MAITIGMILDGARRVTGDIPVGVDPPGDEGWNATCWVPCESPLEATREYTMWLRDGRSGKFVITRVQTESWKGLNLLTLRGIGTLRQASVGFIERRKTPTAPCPATP
jgi:hypothetical protein